MARPAQRSCPWRIDRWPRACPSQVYTEGRVYRSTKTDPAATQRQPKSLRSGHPGECQAGSAYPPDLSRKRFTHKSACGARGFLHWRLSYASARNPSQTTPFPPIVQQGWKTDSCHWSRLAANGRFRTLATKSCRSGHDAIAVISALDHNGFMKRRTILLALLCGLIGSCFGFWVRGYVDSDSCYDAGGVWESRGGYCYGARSADE